MTHTPLHGPWVFTLGNADNPNNGEIRDNRGHLLNLRAVMTPEDKDVMHAMAAAPELLEALEAILTKADQLQGDISAFTKGVRRDKLSHRASGIQLIASHAIAKARGN